MCESSKPVLSAYAGSDAKVATEAREPTVGEFIDQHIDEARRELARLQELRAHLPTAYLNRSVSQFPVTL